MASSFIKIDNIGFWARDGFVEAMQLCLIHEIENQNLDSTEWINGFKNELALQALPMIYGGMSMGLEKFITTTERRTQVVELIDLIVKKIDTTDNYITGPNLHDMRKRAMHILSETGELKFKDQDDFERTVNDSSWNLSDGISAVKNRYQHAFKLLKMLIIGNMNTTASSPETYWNF